MALSAFNFTPAVGFCRLNRKFSIEEISYNNSKIPLPFHLSFDSTKIYYSNYRLILRIAKKGAEDGCANNAKLTSLEVLLL